MFVVAIGEDEFRTERFTQAQITMSKKRHLCVHTRSLVESIGRCLDAPAQPCERATMRSWMGCYATRFRAFEALDGAHINTLAFMVLRCEDPTYYGRHIGCYPASCEDEAFKRALIAFAHALPLFKKDETDFCEGSVYFNLKASILQS